jgi:putative toxin-antitoxin system antitoxin component (TIGR02293 family)
VNARSNLESYIGIRPTSGLGLATLIENGLPTRSLDFLKERGLTSAEIAATIISPRTLKRREVSTGLLSWLESERAVRMASIVCLAELVFGNLETALRWLRQKDDSLRYRTPLSMLRTEPGGRLIESILSGMAAGNERRAALMNPNA